jgi:hypothetical protein
MKSIAPAIIIVLIGVSGAAAKAGEPQFAAHASLGNHPALSPNGKSTVSLRLLDDNAADFPTEVSVRTGKVTLTGKIEFGLNAEVLWNADSTAFAVTGSSEGANGQYHTDVFIVRSNHLVRVRLTHLIEAAFGHPVKCGWPEVPNVAAIKWLDGSKILVAAEIIAHSNCDSFGTFKGFVVDVRGPRVLRQFDQLTVKRLYESDLGVELRDANDSCIRKPESCFVSTNHPDHKQ